MTSAERIASIPLRASSAGRQVMGEAARVPTLRTHRLSPLFL